MQLATGIACIICGIIPLILFEMYVVAPALKELPSGARGELYGPIMWLRLAVDPACIVLVLAGIIVVGIFQRAA